MPLTNVEFEEACLATCPLCREKVTLRHRAATDEWVHDGNNKHGICWASGLRKERARFVEKPKNG